MREREREYPSEPTMRPLDDAAIRSGRKKESAQLT